MSAPPAPAPRAAPRAPPTASPAPSRLSLAGGALAQFPAPVARLLAAAWRAGAGGGRQRAGMGAVVAGAFGSGGGRTAEPPAGVGRGLMVAIFLASALQLVGEAIVAFAGLPVPGAVLGLVLLYII